MARFWFSSIKATYVDLQAHKCLKYIFCETHIHIHPNKSILVIANYYFPFLPVVSKIGGRRSSDA